MFAPGAQTPRPPGTVGKRVPCGHLREAQSDPKVGSETSGGRVQRPPRRLSDREKPGDMNPLWRGRREASAQWAVARSAKRPEGVNRNERWARPAPAAMIEVAGLRALQTSRKKFVNGLKPCCARLPNPPHMSLDSDFILEGLRALQTSPQKQIHPKAGRPGEATSSPGAARFLSI